MRSLIAVATLCVALACIVTVSHFLSNSSTALVLTPGQKAVKKASWQNWEDNFFHPFASHGKKLTNADRLKIQLGEIKMKTEKKNPMLAKKAHSWQSWEDQMFGHSMQAVAARMLPPRHPKNAAARHKHKSLVNSIADKSWVSQAEVNNVDAHKAVRFVDTIS